MLPLLGASWCRIKLVKRSGKMPARSLRGVREGENAGRTALIAAALLLAFSGRPVPVAGFGDFPFGGLRITVVGES